VLLVRNEDRPGIVGKLGTVLARHAVNIASMSLGRDAQGGQALTVLVLDSKPDAACLGEITSDPAIASARVVVL